MKTLRWVMLAVALVLVGGLIYVVATSTKAANIICSFPACLLKRMKGAFC